MKAEALKLKWRKEADDTKREMDMDDKRLNERCPEARHFEAYDWCNLSDNICIRNTGNEDFDVECDWSNEFLDEIRLNY